MRSLLAALLLLAASSSFAQAPPLSQASRGELPILPFPASAQTVNILHWDTNALPKIYQRSEQMPLSDEEIAKLSKAGFDGPSIVKMIEERRCACDASADGLIKLKEQGVPKDVLMAVSLHGLKPNRALNLLVTIDFAGAAHPAGQGGAAVGVPREGFLYFFIDDGDVTRVFSANLADLLSRPYSHQSMVDQSDLLLTKEVRRIELPGQTPLKAYGKHTLLVVASARPTLTHPSQLSDAERAKAQSYSIDYPRASLQSLCRLNAAYKRDAVLANKWDFAGSRLECEWN